MTNDRPINFVILALLLLSVNAPMRLSQPGTRLVEGHIRAPLSAYLPQDAVVVLMDRTESIMGRQSDQPVPEAAQIPGELLFTDDGAHFRIELPALDADSLRVFTVEIAQNYLGANSLHPLEQRLEQGTIAWRSIVTSETRPDIQEGALIVYAPAADMAFSAGRGKDGLLFTADDPEVLLPTGYSIVQLDGPALDFSQPETATLKLHPVAGLLPTDLRDLSYDDAFDRLIDLLSSRYAYSDLYGIDWQALRADYRGRVVEGSPVEWYWLLAEMASRFPDRHVFAAPEPRLVRLMNPDLDLSASTPPSPAALSTEIRDGYAVARFQTFVGGRQTISQWQAFIADALAQSVKGMVVDLRAARGGDGALAVIMAAHFFSAGEPMRLEDLRLSRFDASLGEFSRVSVASQGLYAPDTAHHFGGPVALLVGPECISACELFAYLLRARALIAGSEATAGAGGAMNSVRLPGDVSFFYTFLRAEDRTGTPAWEGRGIIPAVVLEPATPDETAFAAVFALLIPGHKP